MTDTKTVLVIDENLPLGVIANTAAVLGVSIGHSHPDIVGHELEDNEGDPRKGITTVALPILKGNRDQLSDMRKRLKEYETEIMIVDLISSTNTTKSYDEYAKSLKETPTDKLKYLGIALSGNKKIVNKFTGNLGLLR